MVSQHIATTACTKALLASVQPSQSLPGNEPSATSNPSQSQAVARSSADALLQLAPLVQQTASNFQLADRGATQASSHLLFHLPVTLNKLVMQSPTRFLTQECKLQAEMLCMGSIKVQTQLYLVKAGREIATPVKVCDFVPVSYSLL